MHFLASRIELVGPFQLDTTLIKQVGQDAVGNGRPNLGLDVITDKLFLMIFPLNF
ncbi:uncharacterized protein METZ01_LOCUS473076, partial [marine metagenome]